MYKANRKGTICKHIEGDFRIRVVRVVPHIPHKRDGNLRYPEYCMYSLITYKPWLGCRESLWDGEVGSVSDIVL